MTHCAYDRLANPLYDVCCAEFGRTHIQHGWDCVAVTEECAYCQRFGSSELTCECGRFCGRYKCSANPKHVV